MANKWQENGQLGCFSLTEKFAGKTVNYLFVSFPLPLHFPSFLFFMFMCFCDSVKTFNSVEYVFLLSIIIRLTMYLMLDCMYFYKYF